MAPGGETVAKPPGAICCASLREEEEVEEEEEEARLDQKGLPDEFEPTGPPRPLGPKPPHGSAARGLKA